MIIGVRTSEVCLVTVRVRVGVSVRVRVRVRQIVVVRAECVGSHF